MSRTPPSTGTAAKSKYRNTLMGGIWQAPGARWRLSSSVALTALTGPLAGSAHGFRRVSFCARTNQESHNARGPAEPAMHTKIRSEDLGDRLLAHWALTRIGRLREPLPQTADELSR